MKHPKFAVALLSIGMFTPLVTPACDLVWTDVSSEFVNSDGDLAITLTVRNDGDRNCVREPGFGDYSWLEFPDGSLQWQIGSQERLWQPHEITAGTQPEKCGLHTIVTDDDIDATHLHCGGPGWPMPRPDDGGRQVGLDLEPGETLSVTAVGQFAADDTRACISGKIYKASRFYSTPGILEVCVAPEDAQARAVNHPMRITRFDERPTRLQSGGGGSEERLIFYDTDR